ncbi:MAG: MC/SLC25 family protein [Chlamydiota bacterium]|nr:MC/SLC25 family protein [Chlamydiota bacterium]
MTGKVTHENHLLPLIWMGAIRSTTAFPFEHPLELVKLTCQATPTTPTFQVVKNIFKNEGMLGFSKTILTNFPRRVLKEAVRWPVIGYTHQQITKLFPNTFPAEGTASKLFTGASVALFDSAIILPLEQLMAFKVKERKKYPDFFKNKLSTDRAPSLYRGLKINLIRQSVLWCTLMGINNECKKCFDLLDSEKAHPFLRQGITSIFISLGLISWCLPIDFIKTRIQMDKSLSCSKLTSVTKTLLRQHGFKGFYAGALPVFIHTIFHATIIGYFLDKIYTSSNS